MKRLLFLFFVAIGTVAPSHAASIVLSGPSSSAGSFDLDVDVTNVFANFPGEAVTGFGFNVTIGAPVVMLTGVTVNGVFFDDFSGCCLGTDIVGLTNSSFLGGVGPGDFTEPLLLATLHFSVTGAGPTTIGLSADNSADPNQGLSFLTGAESFSTSQPFTAIAAVPEPASVSIAGLGMGLLYLARKRITCRSKWRSGTADSGKP